ncbi:MAG: bifunctional adenosylcobinamide kinase/adenosylcobinamide-phosphate guanylyltransferase [Desulfococcus sp.]|nr:MAG: bifunctional adenosylcobinamide kinase/adenosylcobinamide-phosphate guanylyltransferase [Desulfococcus sp.]
MVIGGCRSGKSRYAQKLTEAAAPCRIYLATCVPLDEEMAYRVRRHREDRDESWTTVEEPLDLPSRIAALSAARGDRGDAAAENRTALLVDCLTLWISNLLFDPEYAGNPAAPESPEAAAVRMETRFADLVRVLSAVEIPVFLVSNETGCGIVPGDALSRLFRDMAGRLNQMVAAAASRVTWMVAGIPVPIKPGPAAMPDTTAAGSGTSGGINSEFNSGPDTAART